MAGPVVSGRVQAFEPRAERVALAADFEQLSYHPRPELLRRLSKRPADSRRYVISCTDPADDPHQGQRADLLASRSREERRRTPLYDGVNVEGGRTRRCVHEEGVAR